MTRYRVAIRLDPWTVYAVTLSARRLSDARLKAEREAAALATGERGFLASATPVVESVRAVPPKRPRRPLTAND